MTALALLLGALGGLGLFMAGVGLFGGTPDTTGPRASEPRPARQLDKHLVWAVIAVSLGVAAGFITRWPVAAVGATIAVLAVPPMRKSTMTRLRSLERTDAVAGWTEMLRDTMAAAAGLNEAIIVSARVAPIAIRVEVQALAARSEHQPLVQALRRFANELDDAVADAVVAALILSTERQAGSLGPVLTQIARNARDQAAMRQRIEASRARTYASARFVVIVALSFSVGLIAFAPTYLRPFGTVEGQLALAVVFGLFGGAGWSMHRLGQPAQIARLQIPELTR